MYAFCHVRRYNLGLGPKFSEEIGPPGLFFSEDKIKWSGYGPAKFMRVPRALNSKMENDTVENDLNLEQDVYTCTCLTAKRYPDRV